MLCGVQGSGKSTFSKALKDRLGYEVINQDDLGNKTAFFDALHAAAPKKKVIVDKCNPTRKSRKEVLDSAFGPKNAMCVHFDMPIDICIQRADSRPNHPTILQGKASVPVKSMAKMMEPPTLSEGFSCIARVTSLAAINELLTRFGGRRPPNQEK